MAWTTDDLVAQFRLEAWLADADDLGAAGALLLGDAELRSIVSGRLKVGREEHWLFTSDVAITTVRIRLPRRCLARAVRVLTVVDSAGAEQPFELVEASEAWRFGSTGTATPVRGYLEDDEVVLVASPSSGYSLRFKYLRRPSRLVPVASCAGINTATSTVLLKMLTASGSAPATLTTANAYVDIVKGDEPHSVLFEDRRVASYSGSDLTLDAATPIVTADINSAGNPALPGARVDYVCPRDQTCLPALPAPLCDVLVSAMVVSYASATTNEKLERSARAKLGERIAAARAIMEPRTSKKPSLVRHDSPLRMGRFGSRGSRWP